MNLVSICEDAALSIFLKIFKNLLTIVQIVGPISCIVSLTISFISMMSNPDDKKSSKKIFNKVIALLVLFFIPLLVNVVMGLMGESNKLGRCWNSNSIVLNSASSYYVTEGTKPGPIYIDPSDYEHGIKKPSSNNNNNNSLNNVKSDKIIFLGDSRTVQMYAYLTSDWNNANYSSGGVHTYQNDVFVAQGSMGLDWMKNTGIPAATPYMTRGSALVILMGVNDLSNINNYINYVNSNVSDWNSRGCTVYFATVNPCNSSYSHLNSSINNFNNTLKNSLPNSVKIIDTNSYITERGFSTGDGLHYNKETSDAIYNFIKSKV